MKRTKVKVFIKTTRGKIAQIISPEVFLKEGVFFRATKSFKNRRTLGKRPQKIFNMTI